MNQAIRQFAGTIGVALTIGLVAGASGERHVERFDRVWWVLVIGGVGTCALSLPLRTRPAAAAEMSAKLPGAAARSSRLSPHRADRLRPSPPLLGEEPGTRDGGPTEDEIVDEATGS